MLSIGRRRNEGFTIGETTHITVQWIEDGVVDLHIETLDGGERTVQLAIGDSLKVTDQVTLHVPSMDPNWVRLGIDAPREIEVTRDETRWRDRPAPKTRRAAASEQIA